VTRRIKLRWILKRVSRDEKQLTVHSRGEKAYQEVRCKGPEVRWNMTCFRAM
jgi:hypothetical protein